jgi:hypothetical protein
VKKSSLVAVVVAFGLLGASCSLCGCTDSSRPTSSTAAPLATGQAATSTPTTAAAPDDEVTATDETSTTLAVTSTTDDGSSDSASKQTVRYQQNDSHFEYSGRWKTSLSDSASGGSYAFTNSTGASVEITFVGTHLSLIAKKSPKYGKAKVALDGKNLGTIDFYGTNAVYQQKVWGSGTLKPGKHTVTITCTGTKRAAATDTNINLDAVVVTGPLE